MIAIGDAVIIVRVVVLQQIAVNLFGNLRRDLDWAILCLDHLAGKIFFIGLARTGGQGLRDFGL